MSASHQLAAMVCMNPGTRWAKRTIIEEGAKLNLTKRTSMKAMSNCPDIKAIYVRDSGDGRYPEVMYYRFDAPQGELLRPLYYNNNNYYHWAAKWFVFGVGVITLSGWCVSLLEWLF